MLFVRVIRSPSPSPSDDRGSRPTPRVKTLSAVRQSVARVVERVRLRMRRRTSVACRFRDALHWRQVETELLRPHVEHAIEHVGLHLAGRTRNDWFAWVEGYRPAIEALLGAVADLSGAEAQRSADSVRATLAPSLPASWRDRPLSQQALGALLGTEGVTSVLVGMRERAWVLDSLQALHGDPPSLAW